MVLGDTLLVIPIDKTLSFGKRLVAPSNLIRGLTLV